MNGQLRDVVAVKVLMMLEVVTVIALLVETSKTNKSPTLSDVIARR